MLAYLALGTAAHAFCGFYVGGATTGLYNDATMVVLLRSGTRTVLSMQNNYQGPPAGFAMVVPVPQVLQKGNVKILPREVFARVDQLAAPRLVEYWEEDPCSVRPEYDEMARVPMVEMVASEGGRGRDFGVKIEARFEVGEYDVVILSAKDSTGLDAWLRHERYAIPAGAEPVLRPYVEAGTKFFVAKVIPEKVTFVDGRAVLSPLRVHYDSEQFSLPVRLGLLNSKGEQDLIVHVLAPGQRYEVANYNNAFVPTNLRVREAVKQDFGAFYEAVFREVARPGTVVTEYSWDAGSCDPCPTPPLEAADIATLGGDVVDQTSPYAFALTRLHYRYGPEGLAEDLVFRAAPPVEGGRGTPDASGNFASHTATPSHVNNFQGRYAILHPWEGAVACKDPRRGIWGGPPTAGAATSRLTSGAVGAPAPMTLANVLVDGFGDVTPAPPAAPPPAEDEDPGAPLSRDETRRCGTAPGPGGALGVGLVLAALRRRR